MSARDPKGGIRKQGRRFQARITVDGRRCAVGTYTSQREAKAALSTAIAAVLLGEWKAPETGTAPGTLDALAAEWFRHPPGKPKRTATLAEYRRLYENRVRPWFGATPVADLTPTAVQAWVNGMRADGLSQQTMANATGVLARILATAERLAVIPESPMRRVEVTSSRPRQRAMVCLSADQIEALCAALTIRLNRWNERAADRPGGRPSHRAFDPALLVHTMTYAGALRVGELAALRVGDVSQEGGTLRIERAVRRGVIEEPKTRAGRRTVAIPSALRDDLAAHVEGRAADAALFTSPLGAWLDPANLLRHWLRPAAADAALPAMRTHDLRHSGVSLALAAGVPPTDVARWCGHASPAVTLSIYAHAVPGREHVVAEALDAVLARPKLQVVA